MGKKEHHHHHHTKDMGGRLLLTILLNILITVAEIIGGIASGSTALISDALHNFSDVIALIISYVANLLVQKKPTNDKTFGYERSEIVAAAINAITLIIVALFLIKEAVAGILNPKVIESTPVIYLAILSIILNGLSVLIILKDSKESMNIRSSLVHLFSDMLTSIAVLLGGLAMKYWQIYQIDSFISIFIALYLIFVSHKIIVSTFRILMQFSPEDISLIDIEKIILSFNEVKNFHHAHLWQISENEILLEGHLEFINDIRLSESTETVGKISKLLKDKLGVSHSTFQAEFGTTDSKDLVKTHDSIL